MIGDFNLQAVCVYFVIHIHVRSTASLCKFSSNSKRVSEEKKRDADEERKTLKLWTCIEISVAEKCQDCGATVALPALTKPV
jgi:hypothetical protein